MTRPIDCPYLVPFDGTFRVADMPTAVPADGPGKKGCKRHLEDEVERLAELQRVLYAKDHHAILCVFQAMDAAGKDSAIRSVFSGVNPAGFQVSSFKGSSSEELDHDFLWRSAKRLPEQPPLEQLDLAFPGVPATEAARFPGYRDQLRGELE